MPDDEPYRTISPSGRVTEWEHSPPQLLGDDLPRGWPHSPALDRPPHSLRRSAERAALDLAIAELRRIARADPYGITAQTLAKITGLVGLDGPGRA